MFLIGRLPKGPKPPRNADLGSAFAANVRSVKHAGKETRYAL
jgi:hypothetical protein